jgi:hypothetical protein
MPKNTKQAAPPAFGIGARVRVKPGVIDPDFGDIPLGGWAGTVEESTQGEGQATYLIGWDGKTLDAMHRIYRKRCERDGLELERRWLGEEDIEPEDGTPVPIEQPTEITTAPLSEKDQDDRVRMALGLTHDDPLPEVDHETLLTYHRYLASHLKFPLSTTYWEESGPFSSKKVAVTITGLVGPEDDDLDEEYGLLCRASDRGDEVELPLDEIELPKKDPNCRLVSDYAYWFHNW